MSKASYDEVVDEIKRKRSRCDEIDKLLSDLGFTVKRSRSGNHHTYTHPSLDDFHGGDYDCGHGRNPEVKRPYFTSILRVLEKYESELRDINK